MEMRKDKKQCFPGQEGSPIGQTVGDQGTLRDVRIWGKPCLRQVREDDGKGQGSKRKAPEVRRKLEIVKRVGRIPMLVTPMLNPLCPNQKMGKN